MVHIPVYGNPRATQAPTLFPGSLLFPSPLSLQGMKEERP